MRENGVCHQPEEKKPDETPQEKPEETPIPKETTKEDPDDESMDLSSMSKEEKIQRAKELVEKKREEKKLEAEEKERQKELERRKLGQEVQKLKEWQKDQELKELMEKRKKEKYEDKAARDRILAQIAQDRADRALKFGTNTPTSTNPSPVVEQAQKPSPQANTARLQFRLPDGSSDTNTFDIETTLQEVSPLVYQLNSLERIPQKLIDFGLLLL